MYNMDIIYIYISLYPYNIYIYIGISCSYLPHVVDASSVSVLETTRIGDVANPNSNIPVWFRSIIGKKIKASTESMQVHPNQPQSRSFSKETSEVSMKSCSSRFKSQLSRPLGTPEMSSSGYPATPAPAWT